MPLASDACIADSPRSWRAFTRVAGDRKSMAISPPRLKVGSNSFSGEKNLAVIISGFVLGLDVHRANLAAVLAGEQICSRSIMRVIETQACRPRGEHDPAFPLCGDERRTFLSRSVHLDGNHLAVPMQLLRRVGVVVDIDCDLLPLLKPKQWPRELTVISRCGDDALGRNFDWARTNPDGVIGGAFSLRCGVRLSRRAPLGSNGWNQSAAGK